MVVVMEGVGRPHRNALFVNGSILGWTHNRKVGGDFRRIEVATSERGVIIIE